MLFHITAKHDHLTCPRKDPSRGGGPRTFTQASDQVKTIGMWLDGPAHTIYAVVESDSAEAIRKACDGFMDRGPVEVRLVSDFATR